MAKIEDIEIHTGKPDFRYKALRRLEVKCEASNALMPAPTVEEANGRLRALAAKIGANAIIEAQYNSGVSLTSWKSMKATGVAVIRESEERTCPICAETIKRAAVKCRFCGADIEPEPDPAAADGEGAATFPNEISPHVEPLKDNNNPVILISLIGLALFILFLAVSSGG